jgi:collagenase-like PrtC family protease
MSAGLEFSVPYNNNPETLAGIFTLKQVGDNKIGEIYLSGPQSVSGSGRLTPEMKAEDFYKIVDRIHGQGIRVNLTINPTCEGVDWYSSRVVDAKMEFLRQAHLEHGVEAVTVANPIYIKEARRRFPELDICASVLGDIDSMEKSIQFARVGANIITPDVNINRDLELLKAITETTGVRLKLMVNEGCLFRCAFRKFHFDLTSHKSKDLGIDYRGRGVVGDDIYADFFSNCVERTANDVSNILRSGWIRPEDTHKYAGITNFFKLVGRDQPGSLVIRTAQAYLNESWDGDLFDILCASLQRFAMVYNANLDNKSLDKYNFFEKVASCNKKCLECDYCARVADDLLSFGVVTSARFDDMGIKLPG